MQVEACQGTKELLSKYYTQEEATWRTKELLYKQYIQIEDILFGLRITLKRIINKNLQLNFNFVINKSKIRIKYLVKLVNQNSK